MHMMGQPAMAGCHGRATCRSGVSSDREVTLPGGTEGRRNDDVDAFKSGIQAGVDSPGEISRASLGVGRRAGPTNADAWVKRSCPKYTNSVSDAHAS